MRGRTDGPIIDVSVSRTIPSPPERVAAVMFDPPQDPTWMHALRAAELLDPPLAVGSRTRRRARFLGRDISWTTTVTTLEAGRRLELRIDDGPFTGTVRYDIEADPVGSRVTIRNVGTPQQFAWMPTAIIRRAMRSSLARDLAHLEDVVTS